MAEELYQVIQGKPYIEFPKRLDPDSSVEWEQLPKIRKIIGGSGDACGSSDIQVTKFYNRQHKVKPSGMFELFSRNCDDDPDHIRENLIQYIYDNCKEVKTVSEYCLLTGVSLGNWLLHMTHKKNLGDELTLFLLCKLFNRHAVIITKTGLWTTLHNSANEGELAIRAKCDICLILVGQGNTGFGEVVHVMPTKTPSKCIRQQKTVGVSVQQAVTQESREENHVTPNHHLKHKRVTASINKLNILPETGKTHNTRASNGTRTRHTSRQLKRTYRDINYKDLDVKTEDEESSPPPTASTSPVSLHTLHVPLYPRRQSQGIITRNRLQCMASSNTRAKLIRTAIKVEPVMKKEDDVKKEPIVNTRRADRSWPKSARLVHLDRTPCSEKCIVNDHYGKYPDFPDDNPTESHVTPSNNDVTSTDTTPKAANAAKHANSGNTTDDKVTPQNVTPNKNTDQGNTCTEKHSVTIQPSVSMSLTGALDLESPHKAGNVTPSNIDESMEDGGALLDLGSKQSEPEPQVAAMINLPDEIADEVTLPDVNIEFGHDELTSDFLDNDADNSTLLSVNNTPVTDFARKMAIEEGVDCDLELELENLTLLEEQKSKQDNKRKNRKNKNDKATPKGGKPKRHKSKPTNVTPNNTNNVKPTNDKSSSCTSATPGSPKGIWKTTTHGIRKNCGPSHPQNYGCKVCGQLLPSRGELNEHCRSSHPPVLCPVCKKTFSCPNTRD